MKNQFTLPIIFVVLFAMLFLYSRDRDHDRWQLRVNHYERVADSLNRVVLHIHESVKAKDSVLLLYMSSLDKTLEELNKEAKKNTSVISDNARVQDSLISTYCRDMAKLNQRSDYCK